MWVRSRGPVVVGVVGALSLGLRIGINRVFQIWDGLGLEIGNLSVEEDGGGDSHVNIVNRAKEYTEYYFFFFFLDLYFFFSRISRIQETSSLIQQPDMNL